MKDNDPMHGPGRICAVVVTYNRKALLEECLTALLDQTRPLDEIIVIDNASTDGTEDLVKAQFPGVTYVKLARNTGGAGGFHEGMKLAFEKGHDWIWVMDDDSIAMADALEKLTRSQVMDEERVCALASAVFQPGGDIFLGTRRLLNGRSLTKWAFELEKHSVPVERYADAHFEIDTGSFVGFLVRRETIEKVGLPRKEFFIYWDDVEYSLRIRKVGRIITIPSSKIVHKPPVRSRAMTWRKLYYFHRNRVYTCRLHDSPDASFYWRALVTALLMLRRLAINSLLRCLITVKKRLGLKSKGS